MPETPLDHGALILAPSGPDGWFDGQGMVATRPAVHVRCCTHAEAAELLHAVFRGEVGGVAAAVLPYHGSPWVMRFERAEPFESVYLPDPLPSGEPLITGALVDLPKPAFSAAVRGLQERIRAGRVYVANLTVRFSGRPATGPAQALSTLLSRGQGAMSALVVPPSGVAGAIVSISPERFVRMRDEGDGISLEVWPIKGTRPRGRDAASDAALASELRADEKERAEHTMIVDLERNDIGCVAIPGSVVVRPSRAVVPTPYCWQMLSGVHGLLVPDAHVAQALEALFPCGSVTGAPKRAAMLAIAELERSPRGAYCGALVVARAGEVDSSVLIRTLEWRSGDEAAWGSGSGVTIDSDPESEWREAVLKAWPALGSDAVRFA